jgi:PKD repeat protein
MLPRDGDRGQSEVVGYVLIVAILVLLYTGWQVTVVPQENRAAELDHSAVVGADLQTVRNELVSATGRARAPDTTPVEVRLAGAYPGRILFVNPPPMFGVLRTVGTDDPGTRVVLGNATAVTAETRDFWNGSARVYGTGALVYRPDYARYDGAPVTVYENSVLFARYDEAVARTDQTLVDGDRIRIPTLAGEYEAARTGPVAVEVPVQAVSSSTRTVAVTNATANLTLSVPTRLPEDAWRELLADEFVGEGGHVLSVSTTPVAGDPHDRLAITLEKGVTYDLSMAKVGVGTGAAEEPPAYVTDVRGDGSAVDPGGSVELVVEVRDRYNNPVADARVNASVVSGGSLGSVAPARTRTDERGRATFEFAADDTPGTATVEANISGRAAPEEAVTFDVRVQTAVGGGGGSSAGTVRWNRTAVEAQPGVDCSGDPCTYDRSADDDDRLNLTAARPDGAANVPVEFSVSNRTVAGIEAGSDDRTRSGGAATFVLDPDRTGTVFAYVSSTGGGDRIGIEVVNRPPNASFVVDDPEPTVGQRVGVDATNSSDPDGTVANYTWGFGDGTAATGPIADHTYASPGTYDVTLTVTDDEGATDAAVRTVRVSAADTNDPPSAAVSVSASDPVVGGRVAFDGSNSTDPDGSVVAYEWDFGDGTDSTGATTDHRYRSSGTYAVTLTVTDDDGATDSTTANVTVDPAPPRGLVWDDAGDWDGGSGVGVGTVHAEYGDHDGGAVELGPGRADGPLAYWPLDGDGSPVVDAAGGTDGSTDGGVAVERPGLLNTTAYAFDGDDDVVTVPSTPRLSGGPDARISASAWLRPNGSVAGRPGIVAKEVDTQAGDWGLVVEGDCPSWATCSGSAPYVGFYAETGGDDYGLLYGPVRNGDWQHAGFALDQPNGTVTLYYGGEAVATDALPGTVSANSSAPVEVGAVTYGGWYFEGAIDDVRVYDRVLNGTEMGRLGRGTAGPGGAAWEGTLTAGTKSFAATVVPDSLSIEDVTASLPAGTNLSVVVESRPPGAAGFNESSGRIRLSRGQSNYAVDGGDLRSASARFRVRVVGTTDDPTMSPCLSGLQLASDGGRSVTIDASDCGGSDTVAPAPAPLVWANASDWDAAAGAGVVHADFTDHDASVVQVGANATADGLVGYWPLDAEAGTVAVDATGANDGTVVDDSASGNASALGATGIHDTSAVRFRPDGGRDKGAYVDLGTNTTDDLAGGPFTLAAWVRTTAGDKDAIVGFNPPDGSNDVLWYVEGGRLTVYDDDGFDSGGPVVADGEWHHVAVTVAPDDSMAYYLDGRRVYGTTIDGRIDPGSVMSIGQEYDDADFGFGEGSSDFFDGSIDEVRAYDRALSAGEVAELADGRGRLTTDGRSFDRAVDPGALRLENVSAVVPPGTNATVYVESSPAAAPGFNESSAPIALSGGRTSYPVADGNLSTRSAAYRLRVELATTNATVTPCLSGAALTAGANATTAFGETGCGEQPTLTNDPPVAGAAVSPTGPVAGETVTADASNATDPDGTVVASEWDFGDGTTATGETATHRYARSGTYTVTLTVTDDDGATNATTANVTVGPPPARVWNDTADWDAADGTGVVHADFGDHAAGVVELGTPADSLAGRPLVGYWPFDGTGNVVAADVSGNEYDGRPEGGVAGNAAGIHNTTAYEFDGTGWVELSGFPNLGRDFSVVAWVKTDDRTEGGQRVFVDDDSNTGGYAVSLADQGTDGRVRFYSRGMDTVSLDSTGRPIESDQWHLVVGVADLTNDTRTVYVDGAKVGEFDPDTGSWGVDAGNASIGGETPDGEGENRFDGTVDEVRVVDGALSDAAVASLYAASTNATLVTGERGYSGPVDPAELSLANVSLVEPPGTDVTVVVEAYDAPNATWRRSDPIDVTGGGPGPYPVTGLDRAAARYRLRVRLNATTPTMSPCFGGAVLVGGGAVPPTGAAGCDDPNDRPPNASFDVAPVAPTVGQAVTADASNATDPDGTVVASEWDFGDGTTATGETATHRYARAGTYTVTLTVAADDGGVDSTTRNVTVSTAGLRWATAADWDAADGTGVVHADFGDHVAGAVDPGANRAAPGLVAYWPLDEDGRVAVDEVGSFDANRSAGDVEPGVFGTDAFGFGGAAGAGNVSDDDGFAALGGLRDFSVSAWVRNDGDRPNDHGIVSGEPPGDGVDDTFGVRYDESGFFGGGTAAIKAVVSVDTDGDGAADEQVQYESASGVQTGAWQHVVLVRRDGGPLRLFVNGSEVPPNYLGDGDGNAGNGDFPTGPVVAEDPDPGVFIGSGTKGNGWVGEIDEVRLYRTALDADGIQRLYDGAGPRPPVRFRGNLTTDARVFGDPVDPAVLNVTGVNATLPPGTTVTATVLSDPEGDGAYNESDPLTVSGTGPFEVTGLSEPSATYRVRVALSTEDPTAAPCLGAITLAAGAPEPRSDPSPCRDAPDAAPSGAVGASPHPHGAGEPAAVVVRPGDGSPNGVASAG